jgi:hypothetical protein
MQHHVKLILFITRRKLSININLYIHIDRRPYGGINKDSGFLIFSPHANLHTVKKILSILFL